MQRYPVSQYLGGCQFKCIWRVNESLSQSTTLYENLGKEHKYNLSNKQPAQEFCVFIGQLGSLRPYAKSGSLHKAL